MPPEVGQERQAPALADGCGRRSRCHSSAEGWAGVQYTSLKTATAGTVGAHGTLLPGPPGCPTHALGGHALAQRAGEHVGQLVVERHAVGDLDAQVHLQGSREAGGQGRYGSWVLGSHTLGASRWAAQAGPRCGLQGRVPEVRRRGEPELLLAQRMRRGRGARRQSRRQAAQAWPASRAAPRRRRQACGGRRARGGCSRRRSRRLPGCRSCWGGRA